MKKEITPVIKLSLRDQYNGQFTVAIRYYFNGKTNYFPTEERITKGEWESGSSKVQRIKGNIKARINKALQLCGHVITFERFRDALLGKPVTHEGSATNLISLFKRHLSLYHNYTLRTREGYNETFKILQAIQENGHSLEASEVIGNSGKGLYALEGLMKENAKKGIGPTTLNMRMRNVMTVINAAIDDEVIPAASLNKYKLPKAIVGTNYNTSEQIKLMINNRDKVTDEQKWAIDFYYFSILSGGIEFKSMATIRWSDVTKKHFQFIRKKTESSSSKMEYVMLGIHAHAKYVFDTYGVKSDNKKDFVFGFIDQSMNDDQITVKVKLLSEKMRKRMKLVSKKLKIYPSPTIKRARPTFAILAESKDIPMDVRQQMMGHKKITTTQIYMTNLPTERKIKTALDSSNKIIELLNEEFKQINKNEIKSNDTD